MNREYFPYLTIGRFVAALGVLLFHMGPRLMRFELPVWISGIVSNGFLGVSFFFALSGFLLGKIYEPKSYDYLDFLRARYLRIYPTYLLFASPYVLEQLVTIYKNPGIATVGELVLPLLLIQPWFPGFSQALMGPAWTLGCEFFFYSLFPILKGVSRSKSYLWLAIWLFASQMVPIFEILSKNSQGLEHSFSIGYFLSTFPLGYLATFSLGVCASEFRLPTRLCGIAMAIGILWLIVICMVPVDGLYKLSSGVAPPMVLIVLGLAGLPTTKPSRVRDLFVLLGEASFVLYLIHRFAQKVFAEVIPHPPVWLLPLEVLSILMLAIPLHLHVERPLIRRFKPELKATAVTKL